MFFKVNDAISRGARLLYGNVRKGALYSPTVIDGVPADMPIVKSETFGPVSPVIRFATIDEAIQMANDTPFGLAAYFCSSNPQTIARVGRRIESGMVGINTGMISTAVAPFGGVKLSGLGREGSRHGLDEYLNIKYLCQAGL